MHEVSYKYFSYVEDILFCNELTETTTGLKCLHLIDDYFEKKGICWVNCVGVCTDVAAGQILGDGTRCRMGSLISLH